MTGSAQRYVGKAFRISVGCFLRSSFDPPMVLIDNGWWAGGGDKYRKGLKLPPQKQNGGNEEVRASYLYAQRARQMGTTRTENGGNEEVQASYRYAQRAAKER
jgi:hypothetical protein